jgi:hypothetical protein
MSTARSKNLIYAAICAALFGLFLSLATPIWILFLFLAAYYGYKAFAKPRVLNRPVPEVSQVPYGELGTYDIHGNPDDKGYGFYIRLNGEPVFVDLRQDTHLEERTSRALWLHGNSAALEANLNRFVSAHPEFEHRDLKCIGLHSDDLERAEVFWEPEGHTLLRGREFIKE